MTTTTAPRRIRTCRHAILLFVLLLCTTAFGQPTSADKQREKARLNELKRRAQEAALERIGRLKQRFELRVQETGKLLDQLAAGEQAFSKEMKSLLTSDKGKPLASDPTSFMTFLRLHESPAVTETDVKTNQVAIASILKGLQADKQYVDIGYLPSEATQEELSKLRFWVKDRLPRLLAQQATLTTLLAKAPKLTSPEKAKTLAQAIQEYRARWAKLLADSRILGEKLAEPQSQQILVETARLAMLQQAETERDLMQEKTKATITQLKLEHELALLQVRREAEEKRFVAEKAYRDAVAEIARLRQEADADRRVADIRSTLKTDDKLKKAEQERSLALAKSVEVQRLLAPFLAEGYWQPTRKRTMVRGPVSLSALSKQGCLSPDKKGLTKLLHAGRSGQDKERPRWGYPIYVIKLSPQQRTDLIQAQKYLRELGPVMVQAGMLAP